MPVEIMSSRSALRDAGDAVADQRLDIGTAGSGRHFAGADAVEQAGDLREHFLGMLVNAGAESAGRFGSAVGFERGHLILDLIADELTVGFAATGAILLVHPE